MKRATIVNAIITGRETTAAIHEKYKKFIPKEFSEYKEFNGWVLNLPLEPNSPELESAIREVETFLGHKASLFSKVKYTKKEIDNTPFFQIVVPEPLELEGTTAKDYGTKYAGSCPICGRGGKLDGNVLIDRKFVKNRKIANLYPDYIVSEETRRIIEENGLTGVSFDAEVKDYKGRDMEKFYVMNIHSVLPPLSETTWFHREPSYKSCGHDKLLMRSDLQYESYKLENAMDFNLTQEHLNNDYGQKMIVSAKARRVFIDNKIRVYRYIPIYII